MRKVMKTVLCGVVTLTMMGYGSGTSLAASLGDMASGQGADKAQAESKAEYAEGEVLVQFAPDAASSLSEQSTASKKKSLALQQLDTSRMEVAKIWSFESEDGGSALSSKSAQSEDLEIALVTSDTLSTEYMVKVLEGNGNVAAVTPNYAKKASSIPNETYSSYLWNLENTGQYAGTAGISTNVSAMWDAGTTGTEQVVAIIDTGVDYTHPDLKNNIWDNPYIGKLAGRHGYDFANGDSDPMDDNGHGTHCAGIIGAEANGEGVVGINQNVKIMALKFLDESGGGYDSNAIAAYNYIYRAIKLGVNVVAVNNSWGGAGTTEIYDSLFDTLGKMGAVTVCAAGNEGNNNDEPIVDEDWDETYVISPACSISDYCVSVAAINEKGELASFSNYGKDSVDIASPGTEILSSVSYDSFEPAIYSDAQRSETCSYYDDFEGAGPWSGNGIDDIQLFINGKEVTGEEKAQYLSYDTSENFGDAAGTSLLFEESLKKNDSVAIVLPYELEKTPKKDVVAVSLKLRTTAYSGAQDASGAIGVFEIAASGKVDVESLLNGNLLYENYIYGEDNFWKDCDEDAYVAKGKRKLVVYLEAYEDASDHPGETMTCRLDCVGVSKVDADTSAFGKWDIYNGTSMATPAVTGAIALVQAKLAAAGESADALSAIDALYSYEVKTPELAEKISTGGYLDFSKISSAPILGTATVNAASGDITLAGLNLFESDHVAVQFKKSGAEDSAYADAIIKSVAADGKQVVIQGTALMNCKVDLKVTTDKGVSTKKGVYLVKGKSVFAKYYSPAYDGEVNPVVCDYGDAFNSAITDGACLYGISGMSVVSYDPVYDEAMPLATADDYGVYFGKLDGTGFEEHSFTLSDLTCVDGNLYVMGSLSDTAAYEAFSNSITGEGYFTRHVLLKVDMDEESDTYGLIVKAANLPAAFDGVEGMSLASYNGKLYIMGGYDAAAESLVTRTMVLNANGTWSDVPSMSLPEGRACGTVLQTNAGLVYTLGLGEGKSCPANLVYNGSGWKVSSTSLDAYDLVTVKEGSKTFAGILGGSVGLCNGGVQYIGLKAEGLGDVFKYNVAADKFVADAVQFSTTPGAGTVCAAFTFGSSIYVVDSNNSAYKAATTNGLVRVSSSCKSGGSIIGADAYYAPGSVVTLAAEAANHHYVKSFSINGAAVKVPSKADMVEKTFRVTSNVTASATWGNYVTKIKPAKKTYSVAAGKSVKIKYKVTPTNATSKKVKFKSSNKKWATVSSKGVVKAKAAGKGKTVKITITAKDGSGKKATVKVKIK